MSGGRHGQGQPECFGRLEVVFPMGPQGLREVAQACWDCQRRVDCLRLAVAADRQQPQGGQLSPAGRPAAEEEHGVGGFLRRWSRLKSQAASKEGS